MSKSHQRGNTGKGKGRPKPTPLPTKPEGWAIFYSSGSTLSFTPAGEPIVTFPTSSSQSLNMLTKRAGLAGGTLHVTVDVATTGSPVFNPAQGPDGGTGPPAARPYIEVEGWEQRGTADPAYPYLRWWSRPGFIALAGPGTFALEVPLTPDRWSGVNGQFATENAESVSWFEAMVSGGKVTRIGFVFGAGRTYGHGLFVTGGTATLTVQRFE